MLPYRISIIFFSCLCQQRFALHADFGPPPIPGFPGFPPLETSASSRSHNSHCALLIPGHGKSSRLDHTLDVFNRIHGPNSGGDGYTCITFQSVDSAFIAARDKFGLPRPKKPITSPDLGNLGRVLVEATKIIAKQYSLPKDVIVNGLPLINSLKSIIGTICFDFLKKKDCKIQRYRSYDGTCNNLHNPTWGATLTTFKRRIGPDYANGKKIPTWLSIPIKRRWNCYCYMFPEEARTRHVREITDMPPSMSHEGIDVPRVSKNGHPLPSARAVSAHIHRDEGLHDHAVTIMNVAWGQALDHDLTLTAETKLPGTKEDPRCCDRDINFPECFPIMVSKKDAFYALFKQNCLSVVRSVPGVPYNCKFGPRSQINEVSAYIDANWVYGSTMQTVNRVRLFKGGLLKSLPVFREFGLKDMLPLKMEDPEEGCIRPNKDLFCFDAGDGRVNEQLVLAVIHVLMMREHNRIAIELNKINPHWGDEKLYQETRNIITAQIQHITYNEYLPMTLGKEIMQKFGLILEKHGYFDGYDPKIDVSMSSDFITSAFRFGHSLLPSTIERWSPSHKYIASQRLSEMLRQPYDLYKGGWCDQFIMGLVNQVAQAMDDAITQEVTNHLFQEFTRKFGMDLAALNMQRGREHGVPSYNEFRHFCGLHPVRSWNELEGVMPNKTVKRYVDIYKHPDDIDLWSGGVTERPLPGSMVGPTFACLIGITFKELRYGDRFWYENKGYPSSFTPGQLEEIRKVKFSRIICDNSDDIKTLQVYVMVLPDHDINPRVSCASGILPRMDLSKWRDHHHGPIHPTNAKHHFTNQVTPPMLPPITKSHFLTPLGQEEDPPHKDFPPSRNPSLLSSLQNSVSEPLSSRFISQDITNSSSSFPFPSSFHPNKLVGSRPLKPMTGSPPLSTPPNSDIIIPGSLFNKTVFKSKPIVHFSHPPSSSYATYESHRTLKYPPPSYGPPKPFYGPPKKTTTTTTGNSKPSEDLHKQHGHQKPSSVSLLHDPTVSYCDCEGDFKPTNPRPYHHHHGEPLNNRLRPEAKPIQKLESVYEVFGLKEY